MLKDSTADVLKDFKDSLGHWRIWYFWGKQDIKGRYRRSFFGGSWVIIHLLVWSASAAIIYGKFFNQNVVDFMPYVMVGFSLWGFFNNTLAEGGNAFLAAEGYIKQIPFPSNVYLLRNFTGNVINFLALIPVMVVTYIALDRGFSINMLWAIPGLLVIFLISFLHIVIVAHLTLIIKDLPHAIGSLMQPLFFITPLIYVKEAIPAAHSWVYEYNILFYMLEVVRRPLVSYEAVPFHYYVILGGYTLLLLAGAIYVSRCLRPQISYKL
ncbi:ABC transporter permease [Pseudoalteromonas sp. XMcav1-K]|uniref:ABC transporter permease n=1 Tax=Pseudoalteromonas sp. XMcav1-K TaxID=3374372 RepID=UPI0037578774